MTYEDRPDALPGVEILVRSLAKHAPDVEAHVFSPLEEIARRLSDLPSFHFVRTDDLVGRGWSVKPEILKRGLARAPRALWLDSDIVMIGDISRLIARTDEATLLVGTEYPENRGAGGKHRAECYGVEAARALAHSVNSGIVLASRRHAALLDAWAALMAGELFRREQRKPAAARRLGCVGDQDALWVQLVSAAFSDVPVDHALVGSDVILSMGANGYRSSDRLARLRGARPVIVHMAGVRKPWSFDGPAGGGGYVDQVSYELSPYFEAARDFSADLGDPIWLTRRTSLAKALNALFLGQVELRGWPLALAAAAASRLGLRRR